MKILPWNSPIFLSSSSPSFLLFLFLSLIPFLSSLLFFFFFFLSLLFPSLLSLPHAHFSYEQMGSNLVPFILVHAICRTLVPLVLHLSQCVLNNHDTCNLSVNKGKYAFMLYDTMPLTCPAVAMPKTHLNLQPCSKLDSTTYVLSS